MCYFLSVGLAANEAICLEQAIPRGLAAFPLPNPSLLTHLPADFVSYNLISGGCSCGLYLGPDVGEVKPKRRSESHARKEYEGRGWSPARLERALAQSAKARARPSSQLKFLGLRPDVRDLLAAVAQEGGPLAIVIHFYHKTELFTATKGPTITSETLLDSNWLLPEDEVTWVDVSP